HRAKLGAPPIERAKVAGERLGHALGRLAVASQAREVELVQQRRVERHELLALEAVEDVTGCGLEVERRELLGDGVQAPQRPAVVVLVVALDQLGRESVQGPRTAVDLFQLVAHGVPPSVVVGNLRFRILGWWWWRGQMMPETFITRSLRMFQ